MKNHSWKNYKFIFCLTYIKILYVNELKLIENVEKITSKFIIIFKRKDPFVNAYSIITICISNFY
jgi:hypothetical protein